MSALDSMVSVGHKRLGKNQHFPFLYNKSSSRIQQRLSSEDMYSLFSSCAFPSMTTRRNRSYSNYPQNADTSSFPSTSPSFASFSCIIFISTSLSSYSLLTSKRTSRDTTSCLANSSSLCTFLCNDTIAALAYSRRFLTPTFGLCEFYTNSLAP